MVSIVQRVLQNFVHNGNLLVAFVKLPRAWPCFVAMGLGLGLNFDKGIHIGPPLIIIGVNRRKFRVVRRRNMEKTGLRHCFYGDGGVFGRHKGGQA